MVQANQEAISDAVPRKLTTLKPMFVAGLTFFPDQNTLQQNSSNVVETLLWTLVNSFVVLTKYTRGHRTVLNEAAVMAKFLTRLRTYVAGLICIQMVYPIRYVVVGRHTTRTL